MFEPVAETRYDEHLAGLNRSFDNWGARDRLDWVLRPFGGQSHDVFAAVEPGGLVAGSIVSYRYVSSADQAELVGIMTGSWTDPSARGRGMFTSMIEHSSMLARERGAVALLAFVTSDNASRRRLEAAGSVMVPTWYLSVPAALGEPWTEVDDVDAALDIVEAARASRGEGVRFVYPSLADLRGQLVERSPDVRILTSAAGAVAVVERAGSTVRVLASTDRGVDPHVVGASELFRFSTDPDAAAHARTTNGARVTEGFLTILPLTESWHCPATWDIESGDRI